jgi:serine/threonine protein phosphatase PrpC
MLVAEMTKGPEAAGDRAVAARLLRRAVRAANLRVWQEGQRSLRRRGMGTTCSAALTCGDHVVLAQVGDSRAYVWRAGALTQVTRDQSVVSALMNAGRLSEDEAKAFVGANVILQALGVAEDVEVSLSLVELRAGDVLMVCSDGLHNPVGDDGLRELFAAHEDLGQLGAALVARARASGGPDNITLVLGRFGGAALRAPASPEDLPRFVEYDPAEEGEQALTSTSRVARRLAARAGMADDTPVAPLPATGQHPALTDAEIRRSAKRSIVPAPASSGAAGAAAGQSARNPAAAALAARSKLSAWAWVVAVAAAVALAVLAWWKA